MSIVMGLDVSTSCTGVAILDSDDLTNPVCITHLTFGDCKTLWEKADKWHRFCGTLKSLPTLAQRKFDAVYVEESLLMFRPGMSSATTIAALTKFNGLVSYVTRLELGVEPKFIPATTARKTCGIAIKRQPVTSLSAKEQVRDWATSSSGPLSSWKFDRTKTGALRPYVFDEIDAYVVCLAGVLSERGA